MYGRKFVIKKIWFSYFIRLNIYLPPLVFIMMKIIWNYDLNFFIIFIKNERICYILFCRITVGLKWLLYIILHMCIHVHVFVIYLHVCEDITQVIFFSFYIFNIVFKLLNNFFLLNLGKFRFEIVQFSKINFGWIGQSIVYNTINISIN